MSDALDDLLARLAAAPAERALDALEQQLCADIAQRRHEARAVRAMAPVRLAVASLALAAGVAAGGLVATATGEPRAGAFRAATELAPSMLLDGVG